MKYIEAPELYVDVGEKRVGVLSPLPDALLQVLERETVSPALV